MKAVVFDMDGVLFDTEKLCMDSWILLGEEMGIEGIEEYMIRCIGRNAKDSEQLFYETYGYGYDYPALRKLSSEREHEKIDREGMPIKLGVYEILQYLKDNGYQIGLASSTRYATVMKHLTNTKLVDYFKVVVTGDMVEKSKPNPEIYLLACEKLGVDPSTTYAIEDSPNGIRAAFSAGMIPLMVPDMIQPDEEMVEKSHRIFKDLLEVKEFLSH